MCMSSDDSRTEQHNMFGTQIGRAFSQVFSLVHKEGRYYVATEDKAGNLTQYTWFSRN